MASRTIATYGALRDLCHEISESGQISSIREREQRKARIYWEIGDAIHGHLLRHEGKPRYGDGLYPRLARDLKMARSLLYTIVQFRQQIPNVHTCGHLAWSHCRQLLPLKSAAEREFYARAARRADWTVAQLKEAIGDDAYGQARRVGSAAYLPTPASATPDALEPQLGQPYTYRLVRGLPGQEPWLLDLGFGQYLSPPGLDGFDKPRDGLVVTARKSGTGDGATYRFLRAGGRKRRLYTYVAIVERVIDGDTLLVRVDYGFRIWSTKRLRLRGIDTPELYSNSGREARIFVEEALAAVNFVLIGSRSLDPYGRPIADVMYHPGVEDPQDALGGGIYLNRQLLDEGLASAY